MVVRDPRSGYLWPLDYHRDISLFRSDGSDIRLVWELNRLGHFLTFARAYKATNDERYVTEFRISQRVDRTKSVWPVQTGSARWKSPCARST